MLIPQQLRQTLPSDVAGLFIVDTNFAISHLGIIKGLVESYGTSKALVLIPWVVIQELDGLKSASADYGQANLATLARNAVRFIYDCLKSSLIGLRGQKMNECLAAGEFGDDAILDCARYWHERQDLRSVLLSNDRNLCTKIMIHGMTSISHEPGLNAAIILERVQTLWVQPISQKADASHDQITVNELPLDDDADKMDVDDSSEDMRFNHMFSSLEARTQLPSDCSQQHMVIAPLFDPKSAAPDPFAALAAKAGVSRFEARPQASISQPDALGERRRASQTSKGSFDQQSPTFGMSRSYSSEFLCTHDFNKRSPEIDRIERTDRPSNLVKLTPITIQNILRDLEATMVSALPGLIRKQMVKELIDNDSVDFLLQDEMLTIEAISKTIVKNWFTCFSYIFPEHKQKDGAAVQALASNLRKLLLASAPSSSQASLVVRGWIEVWRKLSEHDIVSTKYRQRQDSRISYWLKHLEG